MSDLPEFLLARITEDEAVAREAIGWNEGVTDWADDGEPDWIHIARWDPARVLAECEAKRQIVESCRVDYEDALTSGDDGTTLAEEVLRALALPYADHRDYDEAWRP